MEHHPAHEQRPAAAGAALLDAPASGTTRPAAAEDRLLIEVRDSVLLLLLCVLVTAGVAGAASGLLSLLG